MNSVFAITIIADITGSTPLYRAVGEDRAQRLIQLEIDRLRNVLLAHGGVPVGQKGDDVLSYFDNADAAIRAAMELIEKPTGDRLSVHVGVHCGPIFIGDKGIYGEAVNMTARFATAANPGETCISEAVVSMLSPELAALLKPIGQLRLKGIADPMKAYSLVNPDADTSMQTRLPQQFGRTEDQLLHAEGLTLVLSHQERSWRCRDNGELKIGRSPDCDVVLPQPWVSRLHAVLSMKSGKLILSDHSTSGTYVKSESGRETQLKRETIMLADSGLISPTLPIAQSEACLQFEILRRTDIRALSLRSG